MQKGQLSQWVRKLKTFTEHAFLALLLQERKREVSFALPEKCLMMMPPLAISQAAPGANLSSFCEVMDYENLQASFSRAAQYEAAGTVPRQGATSP